MKNMNMKKLTLSFVASILIGLSGVTSVRADDTDIYLDPPQVAAAGAANAPNVLLILDTSASMRTNNIIAKGAYNPGTTYSGVTGHDTDIQASKIYWSTDGNPPDADSNQYFADTNNNCEDSSTPLSTAGYYASGGAVVRHDDTGNWQNNGWKSFAASVDQIVDCEADTPGNAQGYLKEAVSGPGGDDAYSGDPADEIAFGNYQAPQYKPTLYTSNYISWHHNSNAVLNTDESRAQIAINAIKSIMNANPNVNFGLEVFNAESGDEERGGHIAMSVGPLTETRWYRMDNTNVELTRHQHILAILNSPISDIFPGGGGTPLAETLWEAYRYLGGHSVTNRYGKPDGGTDGTDWSIPNGDGCAEDPDANTTATKCVGAAFDGRYASPLQLSCQTAYVIFLSDGEASNDDDTLINSTNLTVQPPSGVDIGQALATISGNRLDELSEWMHNNDINHGAVADGHLTGKQNADLYFVGFGSGINASARTLLTAAASKGGGAYYDATDITSLTQSMQSALLSIQTGSSSFSAPALTVNAFNKLYNRDDIYFALFEPSSTVHWDGNIKKFKLCTAAQDAGGTGPCEFGDVVDDAGNPVVGTDFRIIDTADSGWGGSNDGGEVLEGGVGAKLKTLASGSRHVYTYLDTSYSGLSSASLGTLVEIETSGTAYDAFKQTGTGDPELLGLPAAATNTDVQTLINWINGVDAYDKFNLDGDFTDNRWVMADPLHSPPIAVTFGKQSNDNDLPVIKLLTATNDGAIHMFNENTGNEQWSFIPGEMLLFQYELSQEDKGSHIYGVDNKITVHIIDDDNDGIIEYGDGDRVFLFASMRRGRGNPTAAPFNNIYAFDITPTSVLATMNAESDITPKLMWVIQGGKGDYRRLAQTWSEPQPATIRVSCSGACTVPTRDVLLFGGGNYPGLENNATTSQADEGNAIFMASIEDGTRLWWASNDVAKDGDAGDESLADLQLDDMDYPIPSNLALLDINGDAAIDRIYVGDLGGQIWRLDLAEDMTPGSASPNGSTAGYVFADVNCTRDSTAPAYTRDCSANTAYDWRRFFYAPDVAALRDNTYTNSDYDIVTASTGNRADPIDKLTSELGTPLQPVENAIYAFRDTNFTFGPVAAPKPIVEADLYNATADLISSGTAAIAATARTNLIASDGWFIWLQETTEPNWTKSDGISGAGGRVWIGEKGLSKTVIFGGLLYATTYVPANPDTADVSSCSSNEGIGYVYALDLLDARARSNFGGTGPVRKSELGGGIPTELVTVIREDGTVGLVGSSGGAVKVDVEDVSNAEKTFWYVE